MNNLDGQIGRASDPSAVGCEFDPRLGNVTSENTTTVVFLPAFYYYKNETELVGFGVIME